jgi:hypothetical protein
MGGQTISNSLSHLSAVESSAVNQTNVTTQNDGTVDLDSLAQYIASEML